MKMRITTVTLAVVLATPALAQTPVKIGFINTFSGPTAVLGNDMRDAFELALDHLGRKMNGAPVEVLYEDDFLALINKPFDMVVHPAKGHWSGTL